MIYLPSEHQSKFIIFTLSGHFHNKGKVKYVLVRYYKFRPCVNRLRSKVKEKTWLDLITHQNDIFAILAAIEIHYFETFWTVSYMEK